MSVIVMKNIKRKDDFSRFSGLVLLVSSFFLFHRLFEFNWTPNQSLGVVTGAEASGFTPGTATATARIVVVCLTDQDLALKVHRLRRPQKLETLKSESSIASSARNVGVVGVVRGASIANQVVRSGVEIIG